MIVACMLTLKGCFVQYLAHTILLGEVFIERGPSNAVISAGELASFSCTVNVTGNERLQFQIFNITLDDRHNGCHFDTDTYSQTLCSWPNDGINMTCDYSVPYQITCNLTLSGLTEASSTQVICSSVLGDNAVFAAAYLSIKGKSCFHLFCCV